MNIGPNAEWVGVSREQMNSNHWEFSEHMGVFPQYFLSLPPALEGYLCPIMFSSRMKGWSDDVSSAAQTKTLLLSFKTSFFSWDHGSLILWPRLASETRCLPASTPKVMALQVHTTTPGFSFLPLFFYLIFFFPSWYLWEGVIWQNLCWMLEMETWRECLNLFLR